MSRRMSASGGFSTSVRRFIMSSVIGLPRGWTVVANPSLVRRTINGHRHHPGCYGAVESAQPGRWLKSSYTTCRDVTRWRRRRYVRSCRHGWRYAATLSACRSCARSCGAGDEGPCRAGSGVSRLFLDGMQASAPWSPTAACRMSQNQQKAWRTALCVVSRPKGILNGGCEGQS